MTDSVDGALDVQLHEQTAACTSKVCLVQKIYSQDNIFCMLTIFSVRRGMYIAGLQITHGEDILRKGVQ